MYVRCLFSSHHVLCKYLLCVVDQMKDLLYVLSKCMSQLLHILCIYLVPYLYAYVISFLPLKKRWKMQTICHIVIQALTGEQFSSIRPDWLKNPLTGKNMEIDDFSEKLLIGLEYNGQQHYKYTPFYHKEKYCAYDGKVVSGHRHFELQVLRDEMKKTLCDENNVTLIIVPYTVPIDDVVQYIINKLSIIQSHRRSLRQSLPSHLSSHHLSHSPAREKCIRQRRDK